MTQITNCAQFKQAINAALFIPQLVRWSAAKLSYVWEWASSRIRHAEEYNPPFGRFSVNQRATQPQQNSTRNYTKTSSLSSDTKTIRSWNNDAGSGQSTQNQRWRRFKPALQYIRQYVLSIISTSFPNSKHCPSSSSIETHVLKRKTCTRGSI